MKCHCRPLSPALAAASLLLLGGSAQGADDTVAECLAASDASLKSGTEHRLRDERAHLLVCAAAGCPAEIREECIRRVDEVNAAIPTVIFEVKDAAGNDLSAVRVTMDGEMLVERLEGVALSIDPGAHTFAFEAPGRPRVLKHFVIRESQKDRREPITLDARASPSTGLPLAATQSTLPPQPAQGEGTSGLGMRRIVTVVAGIVGVGGVGIGTAFGLTAWSKRDSARNACPSLCSTQEGVDMWNDAKTWGNASTVAFVVGAVGVGTAAVLWFTDKGEVGREPRAQVGLGFGTVAVSGRW
jgi:hypothetical protein